LHGKPAGPSVYFFGRDFIMSNNTSVVIGSKTNGFKLFSAPEAHWTISFIYFTKTAMSSIHIEKKIVAMLYHAFPISNYGFVF